MNQIIKRIIIKNFRLFDDKPRIFEFEGGFTQIIANNGDGKTSLWLALKIGLTGNIPIKMGRLGEDGIIFFPKNDSKKESKEIQENTNSEIIIILNNSKKDGIRPFYLLDNEEDEIIIHTTIPPAGLVKYNVNGRNWKKSDLREVLNRLSINPDDPFLFLEQNKTTSLLEQGPLGLMEALEDTLNLKEIRENLDNALISYTDSQKSYSEIKKDVDRLKQEVEELGVEFDKLQKFKKISSIIENLENELTSRKFLDICLDISKYEKELDLNQENTNKIYKKNKNLNELYKNLENILKEKNQQKNEISNLLQTLSISKGKLENQKKKIEKDLVNNKKELEYIKTLKEINREELDHKCEEIENDYLLINSKIDRKTEFLKNIEADLKILKKGKSIGPKSVQNFVDILKKSGINADLLINTIKIDKNFLDKENKLHSIQLLESILDNMRWAITIFGSIQDFNESIKLAKTHFINNLLILIDQQQEENNSKDLILEDIVFKIKYDKIHRFLEFLIEDFKENSIDYEEGTIKEDFGLRFFKLNPKTLNIDRENRLKDLKQKQSDIKSKITNFKFKFKEINKSRVEISKKISEIDKIDEEPNLILELKENVNQKEKINQELIELDLNLKKSKNNLEDIEYEIKNHNEERVKLEIEITHNTSELNKLNEENKENTRLLNNLLSKHNDFENNKKEIIVKFPNPRKIDYLIEAINENRLELNNIGAIDKEAVKEYSSKNEAYINTSKTIFKANEDLQRKVEDVRKYQDEFKEFIDNLLKELQKHFSTILKRIDYDGRLSRKVFRYIGRRKELRRIEETPELILDNDTLYGINIEIKKPNENRFVKFFDSKGKVYQRHSGGQRALTMLAYLLAIQKAIGKTTVFYFLDEPTPQLDPLNTEFILKLFNEIDVQIILLTPKALPPDFFNEIIILIDQKIKKIPSKILKELNLSENTKFDTQLFIRKTG